MRAEAHRGGADLSHVIAPSGNQLPTHKPEPEAFMDDARRHFPGTLPTWTLLDTHARLHHLGQNSDTHSDTNRSEQ